MPKYWGKQIFTHGNFPEVGQKQKTERKEETRERLNDGDNNGQATHYNATSCGARKAAWANCKVFSLTIISFQKTFCIYMRHSNRYQIYNICYRSIHIA